MELYQRTYFLSRCWGLLLLMVMSLSVNADPITPLESQADWYALLLSFIIEFVLVLGLLFPFKIRIKRLLLVLVLINAPTWLFLRIFMDIFISANFEIWWKQIPYAPYIAVFMRT